MLNRHIKMKGLVMSLIFSGFVILKPTLQYQALAETDETLEEGEMTEKTGSSIEQAKNAGDTLSQRPKNDVETPENREETAAHQSDMNESTKAILASIGACLLVCNPYGGMVVLGSFLAFLAIARIGEVVESIRVSQTESASLSGSAPEDLRQFSEED